MPTNEIEASGTGPIDTPRARSAARLPLSNFGDDGQGDFEPDDAGDDDSGYGPSSYFARSMERDD